MRALCLAATCFMLACSPSPPISGSVAQLAESHQIEVSAWVREMPSGAMALHYRVHNPSSRTLCLLPSRETTRAEAVPPHRNATYWAQTLAGEDIFRGGLRDEDFRHSPQSVFDPVARETDKVFSIPFPAATRDPLRLSEVIWGLNILMYPCDGFELHDDGRYWGALDDVSGADGALFEGEGNGSDGHVVLSPRVRS